MLYKVKAKYKEDNLREFFFELTDGTIENQKPDGPSISQAMKEAVITDPATNTVEWYETCFCPTPLAHEINTVYKHFLTDIETELIEERGDEFIGRNFWKRLQG